MRKLKLVIVSLLAIALLVVISLFFIGYFKPKGAGLLIETSPVATVFINGVQVGRSPYEGTHDPGEVVIKLIPESFEKPLTPFETKMSLVSGIKTIVRREFGESDDESNGVIISFEKTGEKEASLAVVSIPDAAQISLDGKVRGFAPYKTNAVPSGEHQISIIAPGYLDKTFSIKTVEGYKLTLVAKLSPNGDSNDDESSESEEDTDSGKEVTVVEILDTPTGFLRVRSSASTAGENLGQVTPGEVYAYIETDEDTGWFKIEFIEEGKEEIIEGWVSGQYSKIIEPGEETPSPSPST